MENGHYIAAVDLGTTKVVIAVGRRVEKNKVEIVALKETLSDGVIKGDVRNLELAHQAIRDVKEQLEEELGIVIHQVVVGISGKHIQCTSSTGYVVVQNSDHGFSEVNESDVERLNAEMKKSSTEIGKTIIDVIPQVYRVDEEGDISQPVGMEGRRLEAKFNVIVGEEAAIERLRRCFKKAGLSILSPLLQPIASAEAVLSEDEKELGVAVVDIGGGTTDVCIYYDKVIRHIAVIPIGGNVINNDIKNFGILNKHVEKLKTKFGEAIAAKAPAESYIKIQGVNGQAPKQIAIKALAGIIEARMFDIIEYVKNEMDKGSGGVKLGAGVVLTGGGSTLKNLDLLFKQKLGCEVRKASPSSHLTKESAEKVADPKYSTICGVIVDAFARGMETRIDILEREEVVPMQAESAPIANTSGGNSGAGYGYVAPAASAAGVGAASATETDLPGYNSAPENDSYQASNEQQYANQDDSYEDRGDDYDEGGQVWEEVRPKKKGVFGKLKGWLSTAMSEDEHIDDEENY